ncbi:MAG: hypothetical protein NWS20_05975 [Rickettsiaceae bacterium]|nr:hypothetical protein [Rickettsiaceae bacterium]MDP4832152.1 hypothetical protein [Rickettsiaceae bacterium]MDP5020348.1 hypothetical protein [Rickettsiaceae bacterium]MDP5082840.1 hypothetical protein [Rickettsiaceae bacterium]
MSLTFIHDFQNRLYTLLFDDQEIMQSINKIYLGVVQDAKAPFILINILKAEDFSRHLESIYSIDFQISAYAKDNNHQLLVKLADRIATIVRSDNNNFAGYIVAGIKANDLQFEKAKDLVLNKLTISYKALIKKEVYNELP